MAACINPNEYNSMVDLKRPHLVSHVTGFFVSHFTTNAHSNMSRPVPVVHICCLSIALVSDKIYIYISLVFLSNYFASSKVYSDEFDWQQNMYK